MVTELGRLLRIIRVNTGDSTRDMAKKLQISTSLLISIENGHRSTPPDIEERLCSVYNLLESDRKKIQKAIKGEEVEQTKINLTDFSKKKKRVIEEISNNNLSDETLDRISDLIHSETRG